MHSDRLVGGEYMKILVIHGSMRKGNTYALTQEITSRLSAKQGVEIAEIHVAELELPFCRSCHLCFTKGEEYCPHYDIMREVESKLAECDGLIVSGVAYMWALNAAMKNLLDHLAFQFHRPSLFGKKGMVIATAAGAGQKNVTKYLKTVLGQWGINGAMMVTQTTKELEMISDAKLAEKYDKAAEKFYRLIQSQKPLAPSVKNIAVHNAFRAMSLGDFAGSERDTQHWQKDGFRDKAYPVRAGYRYLFGAFVYGAAKMSTDIIGRIYVKDKQNPPKK